MIGDSTYCSLVFDAIAGVVEDWVAIDVVGKGVDPTSPRLLISEKAPESHGVVVLGHHAHVVDEAVEEFVEREELKAASAKQGADLRDKRRSGEEMPESKLSKLSKSALVPT